MNTDESVSEGQTHHRQLEPSTGEVNTDLLEIVGELRDCDLDELPPFWTRVDSLVADLFSDPPSGEADACVAFTYAEYRITVSQDGDVELEELVDATGDGTVNSST